MKKLMIAACAVAFAAAAQAACIDWQVAKNSWVLNSGEPAPQGYTVYLINGDTALDTIAAAVEAGTIASQSWYFGQSVTANAKGSVAASTADKNMPTVGALINFSALIVDDTTDTTYFMVSDVQEQATYQSGADPNAVTFGANLFGEGALTYNSATAPNGWQAVPEPTSGLLLLLGVAGLALKRKRA